MDTSARKHHGRGSSQDSNDDHSDEEQQHTQQEILPDTLVEILRRMQEEFKCSICLGTMEEPYATGCNHTFCHECILRALDRNDGCPLCKTHVTKRSLNKVDHLDRLIKSFLQLKGAFERERGYSLSQAPRKYDSEPIENLSQMYPYPEKNGESSSSIHGQPLDRLLGVGGSIDTSGTVSTISSAPHAPENTSVDVEYGMDLNCFDVDLDTLSSEQAAQLAERMLSMMSLISLEGLGLAPEEQLASSIALPTSGTKSQPAFTSATSPTHASATHISSQRTLQLSQPRNDKMPKVKQEVEDDSGRPHSSHKSRQGEPKVKAEPSSQRPFALEATPFDSLPTQESPSMETNVSLCGTFMSAQKKQQMEQAAKTLKAKLIDDLVTRPTHVVMDVSKTQSANGSGRTVKYFLGVLRACWVVRYEWVTASMSAGYWVDEVGYQIHNNEFGTNAPKDSRASQQRGEPPLLAGYEVQLSGTFSGPTKEEVELIIRAGGGSVVPQLFLRESRFAKSLAEGDSVADVSTSSFSRQAIAADSSHRLTASQMDAGPVRHLLLFDQAGEGVISSRKLKTEVKAMRDLGLSLGKRVEVVQRKVLFECIAAFDMSKLVEAEVL
ncbi:Breast cancer 1, early onset [Mortierella claussenii]|nr:Breast cancer 1, early onset [Mortierella claussenii]